MEPLVSVEWLAEHLDDPDMRVFDATVEIRRLLLLPITRTGEREYRRGHIPAARSSTCSACTTRTGPACR